MTFLFFPIGLRMLALDEMVTRGCFCFTERRSSFVGLLEGTLLDDFAGLPLAELCEVFSAGVVSTYLAMLFSFLRSYSETSSGESCYISSNSTSSDKLLAHFVFTCSSACYAFSSFSDSAAYFSDD